ncbi:flavodoxin FldA [Pantoea sp. Aalb]|uniref:flavodoxin FldA n=1 Tax=Pantoea sp. Aalb TaxID=2576762 RepID=UPI0013270152|nr:flavodoxin FldA [Pantoea sp. Aalb]MXP67543.1 flavodoxin FldA [Pantoea sp. Aalb]
MNKNIGIFFGSDTGNTEKIAIMLQKQLLSYLNNKNTVELYDISKSIKEDLEKFNVLLLGIPTWYYGEVQCDWDDFLPILKEINFYGKFIAIFGCGDQEDYTEYFCDAMKPIKDIVETNGAVIIGKWPIENYYFESSKSLLDDKNFIGLALDEDRQPELTSQRLEKWVKQILHELQL